MPESGLLTSFYVTSLYMDATTVGGPCHTGLNVNARRFDKKNKKKNDKDEFEFAFQLVKHGISKMAIDDIMALRTIKSNLPKQHFKSAYTLGNKIRGIEPGGIGEQWVLSKINYDAENPGTPYYWRDPMRIVEDLVQNPAYRDDLIYTPCKLTGQFGERIYSELHTGDWWWKLQVSDYYWRGNPTLLIYLLDEISPKNHYPVDFRI